MKKAAADFSPPALVTYFLSLVTYFILPMWVVTGINYGALVLKFFALYARDQLPWEDPQLQLLFVLIFLAPLLFGVLFYYLTVRKVARLLHRDFLMPLIRELANRAAQLLVHRQETLPGEDDWEAILRWLDDKINQLPKLLRWLTRKVLAQIPLVEILATYTKADLVPERLPQLVEGMENKLNERVAEVIDGMIPNWVYFIPPFNLLQLALLYQA